MAENVAWALDREGPGGRVLVFAHNRHVMNDHLAGGKWDAVARAPDTLGRFLRLMFADDLFIVDTSSALVDRDGIELVPDGLDAMLARVREPLFLLDLRRPGRRAVARTAALAAGKRHLGADRDRCPRVRSDAIHRPTDDGGEAVAIAWTEPRDWTRTRRLSGIDGWWKPLSSLHRFCSRSGSMRGGIAAEEAAERELFASSAGT
jgi:hypothetical protein